MPEARKIEEVFIKGEGADAVDERCKVEFFNKLSLDETVQLVNLANYLNIQELIDSCLEVIALEMRRTVDRAEKNCPQAITVSKEED